MSQVCKCKIVGQERLAIEESGPRIGPRIGAPEPRRRERLACGRLITSLLAAIIATVAHAGPANSEVTVIHLRYSHADLNSPAAVRRLLARIDDAALEACGASTFSLAEYKIAVRSSRCWQDAVADATRRIGQ